MGVTIVTDSTADLSSGEAKLWGVRVAPLYVNFQSADKGLETLRDGGWGQRVSVRAGHLEGCDTTLP